MVVCAEPMSIAADEHCERRRRSQLHKRAPGDRANLTYTSVGLAGDLAWGCLASRRQSWPAIHALVPRGGWCLAQVVRTHVQIHFVRTSYASDVDILCGRLLILLQVMQSQLLRHCEGGLLIVFGLSTGVFKYARRSCW